MKTKQKHQDTEAVFFHLFSPPFLKSSFLRPPWYIPLPFQIHTGCFHCLVSSCPHLGRCTAGEKDKESWENEWGCNLVGAVGPPIPFLLHCSLGMLGRNLPTCYFQARSSCLRAWTPSQNAWALWILAQSLLSWKFDPCCLNFPIYKMGIIIPLLQVLPRLVVRLNELISVNKTESCTYYPPNKCELLLLLLPWISPNHGTSLYYIIAKLHTINHQ